MPKLPDTEIDFENIFCMFCLGWIATWAMLIADTSTVIPPVVNTIAGGFIGYMTKATLIKARKQVGLTE